MDATPAGHPNLAGRLSNLGNALVRRFERTGDTADLDAAIDAGRQAVAASPAGHPNLATMLANLGNAFGPALIIRGTLRTWMTRSAPGGRL